MTSEEIDAIAIVERIIERLRDKWHGHLRVPIKIDPTGVDCDAVALTGHGRIAFAHAASLETALTEVARKVMED